MKVNHYQQVESQAVEMDGAEGCRVRWLIGEKDKAPNFAMRRFIMGRGGGMPLHTNTVEHEQYAQRFDRQANRTQDDRDCDERRGRHACDTDGCQQCDDNNRELHAEGQIETIRLRDKHRRCAFVQRRTIHVNRCAQRQYETRHLVGHADVVFDAFHRDWQCRR